MAKAKFTVKIFGEYITQGDTLVIDGQEYLYKGCPDGHTLRCVNPRNPMEWYSFDSDTLKGVNIRPIQEVKEMKKTVAPTPKKAQKKAAKTPRKGYSKQRGLDMKSDLIRELSENAVCSYNMWYMHCTVKDDGTLWAHGEKFGRKRESKYTNLKITREDNCILIECDNCSGDRVQWVHDNGTGETALLVLERATQKNAIAF